MLTYGRRWTRFPGNTRRPGNTRQAGGSAKSDGGPAGPGTACQGRYGQLATVTVTVPLAVGASTLVPR